MHEFQLIPTLLTIAVVLGAILGGTAGLIFLERKISAYAQDRLGPNRVGPKGLFQSVADGLKFLLKEEVIPKYVDRFMYLLAPSIALAVPLLAFAVVPFGATEVPARPFMLEPIPANASPETVKTIEAINQKRIAANQPPGQAEQYRTSYQFVIAPGIDIGLVYLFAISSIAVYGVILGGWAANNKYSLLGCLRSSAQIISYEIPLGLSIVGVVLMTGSLNLEQIIWQQASPAGGGLPMWNVFYQPLAFLIFLIAAFAECNRLPFDLSECEQELVGGYHTEYSAMKFAMFFLGEYTHMITTSFLMVILFFGGWHFPWIATAESGWVLKLLVFGGKMFLFIVFYMLVRWTIPRFRFDQLMGLAWRVLIPLSLINLVSVMIVKEMHWSPWLLLPANLAALFGSALLTLAGDKEEKPAAA